MTVQSVHTSHTQQHVCMTKSCLLTQCMQFKIAVCVAQQEASVCWRELTGNLPRFSNIATLDNDGAVSKLSTVCHMCLFRGVRLGYFGIGSSLVGSRLRLSEDGPVEELDLQSGCKW